MRHFVLLSLGLGPLLGCGSDTTAPADTRIEDTTEDMSAPSDATANETSNDASNDDSDGTSTAETGAHVEVDPRCAPILDGCLRRQKTCVIDGEDAKCAPCPTGQYAARPDGACTPLAGEILSHDFGLQTIEPGEEIGSLCQTWILDNDEELWVNAVEMDNDGGYHHSNWFFVPEDHNNWPTGPWVNCYSDGFNEIDAALAGGVLYAQSTQVKHELQKFQNGAAVRVPPRSRIITVTHLLNYRPDPVTTGLRLKLYTLSQAEVDKPLTPGQLIYGDLKIPARSSSFFGGTCDLTTPFAGLFERPLELKLHYVLPHYHDLGAGFEIKVVGGPLDGETIVDLGAYSSDPFGFAFDPPIDLQGATGLSFGCAFDNPRDEIVRWGIGDQEMCEALLFFESPMAFTAGINETTTETTEGELERFTGECAVLGFPFDPRE